MSNDHYNYSHWQAPYGQQPQAGGYDQHPNDPYARYNQPLKHSGPGIASFIVALLAGPAMFFVVVLAGIMAAGSPGGELNEESSEAILIGFAIFGCVGVSFIGLILGIVGVSLSMRNKLFAYLGLGFNALLIIGIIFLMCLGLMIQA